MPIFMLSIGVIFSLLNQITAVSPKYYLLFLVSIRNSFTPFLSNTSLTDEEVVEVII